MQRWWWAGAAASVLAVPTTASAHDACRPGTERLEVSLGHGHATVRSRTTIENNGDSNEAQMNLLLPGDGALTDLRLRRGGSKKWFRARQHTPDEAAVLYGRITGRPGTLPPDTSADDDTPWVEFDPNRPGGRDPGLATWFGPSAVSLSVFPVASGTKAPLQYAYATTVPYVDGRYRLSTFFDMRGCPVTVVVRAADRGDALFFDDKPIVSGRPFTVDASEVDGDISVVPRVEGSLDVYLTTASAAGKYVMHWGAAAPTELSEAPTRADIVVVVDTSRSMTDEGTERARQAAHDYLRALSRAEVDAQVQVLTFDRTVVAHHETAVSAPVAAAELARLVLTTENGSALDDALETAAEWFDTSGRSDAQRRLVLLTDLRTASALDHTRAAALVAATGALVHIGAMVVEARDVFEPALGHPWDAVVRPSGGLVWYVGRPDGAELTEWVRPTRILHPEVSATGVAAWRVDFPRPLREGAGIGWIDVVDEPVRQLDVQGWLWTKRVEAHARARSGDTRALAAIVAGRGGAAGLDETHLAALAKIGHAVSPVSSLIAIEPGAQPMAGPGPRPTPVGPAVAEPPALGDRWQPRVGPPTPMSAATWLREQVWEGWRGCGLSDHPMTISLETTLAEVADVTHVKIDGGADVEGTRCMWSAVWRLALPPSKFTADWERWTLTLDPIARRDREAHGLAAPCWASANVTSTHGTEVGNQRLCQAR